MISRDLIIGIVIGALLVAVYAHFISKNKPI